MQDFERELSASRAETESERGRLNAVINRLETTLVQQGSEVSCICLMPSLVKYSTVNKVWDIQNPVHFHSRYRGTLHLQTVWGKDGGGSILELTSCNLAYV